jgi:hypothetical protein
MVSRETTRPLRKLVPAVAIGVSALLGIVGCSAGQVAQTAEMPPAVNGNMGQVGKLMLRNVQVAFPDNGEAYTEGDDAPLLLTIANTGAAGQVQIIGNASIPANSALQVVRPGDNPAASSSAPSSSSASSSAASSSSASSESSAPGTTGSSSSAETTGSAPSTATSGSGTPSSSGSAAVTTTTEESATDVVGTISLLITGLTGDLPFGKTVPVTFEFAKSGKVTITLPVGAPTTARATDRDSAVSEGEDH